MFRCMNDNECMFNQSIYSGDIGGMFNQSIYSGDIRAMFNQSIYSGDNEDMFNLILKRSTVFLYQFPFI